MGSTVSTFAPVAAIMGLAANKTYYEQALQGTIAGMEILGT